MSSYPGMPFMRAASIDLPSNGAGGVASGTTVPFDSKKLLNEARGPMMVEEIGFLFTMSEVNDGTSTSYLSMFSAKIDYGRYPLTNGYQPIMCMSPSYNPEAEGTGLSNIATNVTELTATAFRSWYLSWRLPKPLFLSRGSGLTASLLFTDDPRRSGRTWQALPHIVMAMKGRALPFNTRPPMQVDVPYVSGFAPTWIPASSKWDRPRSNELELKNPFSSVLHVQRLVARAETGGSLSAGIPQADVSVPVTTSTNQPVWSLVSLTDLHGRPISRDPVAHNSLAGTYALCWNLGVDVDPREGFLVNVLDQPPGRNPTTEPLRLMYHIVGSRQEELLGGCP